MQTTALEKLQRFASKPGGQVFLVVLTLAVSLLVRLLLFRYHGYYIDENSFKAWYNTAAEKGLHNFYDSTWSDYPPFNIYIFWIFGKLAHALGPGSLYLLIKLPQNLFDLATAYLIFRFVRQRYSFLFALGAMAVYALNPATIFDSAVWGQMDSIYAFFMVASLYALMRSKYELSGGLLSIAVLTKPQSVVLLPVVAYVILTKGGWKRSVSSAAVFLALVFLIIAPFHWNNPVTFLIDRYTGYNLYPYNSLNAYNFWALLGFWKPDTVPHLGLSYQHWGIVAFVIFAAFVMWQLHRKPGGRAPVFAAFLLMFGFFMLMTRMHERYLFPVLALLALSFSPRHPPWLYVGLTGTFFANLVYVMSVLNANSFIPNGHWSLYVLSPINAILFFYAIWSFWRMQRTRKVETEPPETPSVPPPSKPAEVVPPVVSPPSPEPRAAEEAPPSPVPKVGIPRSHALILAVLIIFFLSMSLWNLGDRKVPSSDWVPQKDPEEVYVDLGTVTRVEKVWVLVADDNTVNVDLYWGSPGNWTYQANLTESSVWYKWDSLYLDRDTRYVRLLFKGTTARIGEIALFTDGHKLNISNIVGDQDSTVTALTDEQRLVGNPASHTSGTYFDEIYFVRTAEETLKLQEPSERTHPPMSKLIIAASIAVFGHDPFGWRFAGVVCATLGILVIYFFAKRMFKSSRAGLIAAFLLTFEFMHFVQARIATGESFILFFVILMFYCFYRYYENPEREGKFLFLSLVAFGFGFATKWVVMWGFVGLVLLLILMKLRKPTIRRSEVLWFVGGGITAIAIYMLSYIPYFMVGHGLGDWWHFQLSMYDFHAHLTASHPFSSPWWSWPFMLRPLWIYLGSFDGSTANISSMGNPALWWLSLPLILLTIWLAIKKRSMIAAFIVIPFFTQWLAFIFIERVVFIYHFFPNVLFVILAATLWIQWLWDKYKWGKWVVAGYLALNVICFALFFPVISGLPMSQGYWHSMHWMLTWVTSGFGPHH